MTRSELIECLEKRARVSTALTLGGGVLGALAGSMASGLFHNRYAVDPVERKNNDLNSLAFMAAGAVLGGIGGRRLTRLPRLK